MGINFNEFSKIVNKDNLPSINSFFCFADPVKENEMQKINIYDSNLSTFKTL